MLSSRAELSMWLTVVTADTAKAVEPRMSAENADFEENKPLTIERNVMTKRILLAAVLGGIALFIWGSVSHLGLGLGEIGIKELPNEPAVLAALKTGISDPGFYFFPGMGVPAGASAEQKNAAAKKFEEKYMAGPTGILIYHPNGTKPFSLARLGIQFGLNVVQ